MSEPKEWWIEKHRPKGTDAYYAWNSPSPSERHQDYVHVREVDDHDRIYRPEDDDYRLPTEEDANTGCLVLAWDDGIDEWLLAPFSTVRPDETWRRMPRGPE